MNFEIVVDPAFMGCVGWIYLFKGYAYLLIMDGQGTVKTCMFSGFKQERIYVESTLEAFRRLAGLEMKNPVAHGGAGNFQIPEYSWYLSSQPVSETYCQCDCGVRVKVFILSLQYSINVWIQHVNLKKFFGLLKMDLNLPVCLHGGNTIVMLRFGIWLPLYHHKWVSICTTKA